MKRIDCWHCRAYDRDRRRCGVGKANPRRKHEALTVAELLGARSLCMHNPHREPLLLRMMEPQRRLLWQQETSHRDRTIEIEIIEDVEPPEPAAALQKG